MKMNKNNRIEECVSTDKSRLVLNYVCLEGSNLVACDGRMLAVVPIQREENDTDGFIPVEVLKEARKKQNWDADGNVQISANGTLQLLNGTTFPRPKQEDIGTYPKWIQIIPEKTREIKYSICFNAEYLNKLQRAFGCEFLRLEFGDNCEAIRVLPNGKGDLPGMEGVLMPVRCS